VKTNNLASRFGVDPSTITKTISELADSGYITHTPYHGFCLSEKGIQFAEFCIKRHRVLALMLTHYGISHELMCSEVSRFEGLVSRDAFQISGRMGIEERFQNALGISGETGKGLESSGFLGFSIEGQPFLYAGVVCGLLILCYGVYRHFRI